MAKQGPLKIFETTIYPGEALSLALPMPELYSCAPLYMPIKVIRGKRPGPCLLVTAAMYGNALNGTEIIHRLCHMQQVKKLKGTLIAVPVLNVHGFMNRARLLPSGIDLDTCFPGHQNGTHAQRLAHLFTEAVFTHAQVCLDLRTGFINYSNLPQLYTAIDDQGASELATLFNAPVISALTPKKGSLMALARDHNKPSLIYEAGEAMRFDEHSIKIGLKGVLNVMRALAMLPERPQKKESPLKSFVAEKNIWIRASASGVSYSQHRLGQLVQQGERLSVIKDPFGATDNAVVTSPEQGVIVGKNNLPLVHEGEGLFQLAVFPKMQHAASHLEDWKEKSAEHFEDHPRAE